jgi:uroporphyrinogen decarboxylase
MKREPDFENLRRTLLRQGPPGPVPFFELGAEPGVMGAVLGERIPIDFHLFGPSPEVPRTAEGTRSVLRTLDMFVRFCLETGYDFVFMFVPFHLPRRLGETFDPTAPAEWSDGVRYWQNEAIGPIQSWADFEQYPWPRPEETVFGPLDYLNQVVPEGMKVSANLLGIFEQTSFLMGLESLSFALYEQSDLVDAIMNKIGELCAAAARHAASLDNVGVILLSDDMGSNQGTLIKPAMLRERVYPHHKRVADIAHEAGKVFVLHSCGNLTAVMDDLIDDVGMDAKHSFQDAIMPVEEVCQRWGDRISVIGGVDMDLLSRGTEAQVRERTRQILDACAARGTGYCLGSGNSIADYIPMKNYLAMLDEGRRWNREHFPSAS